MSSRPGWPTDPEVLAFIEETAKHYSSDKSTASAQEAREAYDALCAAFDVPHPDGIETSDALVAATDPVRQIPVRTYRDTDDGTEIQTQDLALKKLFGGEDTPSATCLMYLHGGGWIVGGLESHDSICAELCASSTMDVIAVDYRLCPEHRHPAALDDAEVVYRKLAKKYDNVVVGGDSAGGHLAAALCLRLRGEELLHQPVAQLLIYPALGAVPKGGSYEANAKSPGLSTTDVIHYWNVLSDGAPWQTTDDHELAPLRAEDLAGLPPAIITSAGCDPLRDDAAQYAIRLTNAGVAVQWRNDPELIHGHLRGRYMSSTAMAHFNWISMALSDIVMTSEMERMLADGDFEDLHDD